VVAVGLIAKVGVASRAAQRSVHLNPVAIAPRLGLVRTAPPTVHHAVATSSHAAPQARMRAFQPTAAAAAPAFAEASLPAPALC
jgi:hypothetical protein